MRSSNWSITLGALLILGLSQPGVTEGNKPFAVKMAQKQLALHVDCAAARQNQESRQYAKESAAEKTENSISIQHCDAYAHNYIAQDDPQMVVVAPDPDATGDLKLLVQTVSLHDQKSVRSLCDVMAKGTFEYLETGKDAESLPANPTNIRADVATDHDDVACDVMIQGANLRNPLIVLTPEFVVGSAVDVNVLQLIGLKKPTAEIQHAVDDLTTQLGSVAAQSSAQVRAVPAVLLPPGEGKAAISGSLAARLRAPCKLHITCHYGIFSQTCEHKCGVGWDSLSGSLGPALAPSDSRRS
ncbi:MAG TPA: hypothetical protein VIH50_02920 [Steroidobacteraceae bacterium]|jgi:hypothetical protein